ncbi:MAG: hypothetical protein ACUVTR_07200, partial [Dehalococcoidia bacterium]
VLVGCGGAPAEEEEEEEEEEERTVITLDFATFWPATDFQAAITEEAWMTTLSELVLTETTGYKLSWVKTYSVSPPALWTGVKGGTYDVITSGPGYTAGVMPTWEGPEYPAELPGRKNALTMSMSLQALYDESTLLQNEVTSQGVVPMHFWGTGPGYFLMVPGHDVRVLEDFTTPAKQRIRAANPASVKCIGALGAEPVYCPMSAALEKFQAGLIDGILCPTDTPKGFGLGAYVRTATLAPFSYHFVFMKVMNTQTWNSLPAEVKVIFDAVNKAWPEYAGKMRTWGEYDGIKYMQQMWGNSTPPWSLYDLRTENPTEYARWVDATKDLVTTYWIAGNATRQALWDRFVYWDNYYATTEPYKSWTHSWPAPPPVPTITIP